MANDLTNGSKQMAFDGASTPGEKGDTPGTLLFKKKIFSSLCDYPTIYSAKPTIGYETFTNLQHKDFQKYQNSKVSRPQIKFNNLGDILKYYQEQEKISSRTTSRGRRIQKPGVNNVIFQTTPTPINQPDTRLLSKPDIQVYDEFTSE